MLQTPDILKDDEDIPGGAATDTDDIKGTKKKKQ